MAGSTNQGPAGRPTGKKLAQAASTGQAGQTSKAPGKAAKAGKAARIPRRGRPARRSKGGQDQTAPAGRRRFLNYPRAGKGRVMRWIPGWRFFLGCFLALVAALVGLFVVAYAVIDVPSPNQFAKAQTSTVYYADGTTEMGHFSEIDRTIIDTSALPDYVGHAVVASEDASFYTNNGVDPKGILRALWNNLSGGDTQGASTLTQQYVKNYYVDTTSSYAGKFEQAILALKIDRSQSKEEILDSYLNTVYFGRGAYGIEAASQAYFGHKASELTVSESALLAGVLPAPSAYDPNVDVDMAQTRWQRVLDRMETDGYITAEEHDSATFPETITPEIEQVYAGSTGYLLQMVRSELVSDAGLTEDEIDTGGYSIVTTFDKEDQDAAVAAVQALPEGYSENLHVALVSIDSSTGGILALYGGSDYLTNQVNAASDAVAQAGSTFKPFALVGALENGATLSNGYSGASPMTIDGAEFQNFQDVSYGWSNLVKATTYSINTAYLQLNEDVGPEVTNQVAVRAGYPEDTTGMNPYVQNVLGSASPHTVDIATAYATFASQGTRHDTHVVGSVTDPDKTVVYSPDTSGDKVFSDDVMADATYAMQQVVNSGSGTTALELGRPVAAKTGSSSDNKSAQFAGYTPQVATAVTLYQSGADGSEESITPWGEYSEITGSTYPADIFTQYMATALADLPVESFPDRTAGSYRPGSLGESAVPTATARPQEETQAPVEETQAPADTESQAPANEPADPEEASPAPSQPAATQPAEDPGDDATSGG